MNLTYIGSTAIFWQWSGLPLGTENVFEGSFQTLLLRLILIGGVKKRGLIINFFYYEV